jgi:hypothetical protein
MLRATLVAIIVLISAPAIAQDMTAEQRAACKGDYEKFCKSIIPGGGRLIACLSKQSDKLSDACKRVVAQAQKK